ncbi:MAG: TonB-dependent receptor [Acidobacteriaceae bacterium]|nr:TonB-dependent receptor [Acidobacteriaceae bacterium]
MSIRLPSLGKILIFIVLGGTYARAQSSTGTDLEVNVRDASGAPIPDAALIATQTDTGFSRAAQTDSNGRWRFASLPVGAYSVTVTKPGFAKVERRGLRFEVGQVVTIHIDLEVASTQQQVEVTANAPVVEPDRTQLGTVVNRAEIEDLPINGRNFLEFATTVASVTPQQTGGQGSHLSFNGQRGRSNNIVVDGVDNNGQLNGTVRLTLSQDAVQEFQVVTNQFAPEFGRAGGGLVNIVSKSGTNDFHGDLFYFARDAAMDGRNAFLTTADKPQFSRKTPGATLGGPIVRNKTFFFSSVEYSRIDQSGITTISNANVAAINGILARRPIPGSRVGSISNGTFPVGTISTVASLRIDQNFDEKNSATFRYLYGRQSASNGGGVAIGGLTDITGGGGEHLFDQSFLLTYTHIFSPALLSETRFQYAPVKDTQYANDPYGPRITISGVANFGRDVNFPVLLNEKHYQWQEGVSYSHGKHFFKFGTDIDYIPAFTSFPVSFAGSFTFANLAAFQSGTVTTFTQGFGDPTIRLNDKLLGFYAQDSFKVTPRLTLNYGLRYEYDMQPQGIKRDLTNPIEAPLQTGIPRDPTNFQPRFGLAYSADTSGKTVIRAGYGIFYDKIFLLVARNTLLARTSLSLTGAAATSQFRFGAFPESSTYPTALPAGFVIPKLNLNVVDSNLGMPYSQQANFTMDRALGSNWHATASYVLVRGSKLLRSDNINLAPPTILTLSNAARLGVTNPNPQQIGRRYYGSARLDPNFNNIQQDSTSGSSTYHGLELSIERRFEHGFEMRANFTWSKAIDDASDFVQAQQPNDSYDRRAERSLSDENIPERLTLTGVWEIPYKRSAANNSFPRWMLGDWVASTRWALYAGSPQNVVVGSDVNGDGNSSTDRPFSGPYILGRNTFQGPGVENIDFRMAKRIPLNERFAVELIGEAFNVFNHVNFAGVNTVWGTALSPNSTFGQYTSAADPRQLQLAVKIFF